MLLFRPDLRNKKKSSTVKIFVINDKLNRISSADKLICHASIKNDTLIIRNGFQGTDSGFWFDIYFYGNKLKTRYYQYFSSAGQLHIEPKGRIEKQSVTLDKARYSVGDSLFGSIYTRMIDENKIRYYVTGFFRGEVKN